MAPGLSIFGDFTKDASIMYNNFRVFGTVLLWLMCTIVSIGVAFVSKFAAVALACVIGSIIAILVGIFYNINGSDKLQCVLGKRRGWGSGEGEGGKERGKWGKGRVGGERE